MELSELTTLSACFFSRGELNRVKSGAIGDITVLDDFLMECKEVAQSGKIEFGTPAVKVEAIELMDSKKNTKALSEMAVGISGALAVKDWLSKKHNEGSDPKPKIGYLTGDKWPDDVEKFRVEAAGMKDYNSSDFIVYTGRQGTTGYYYGVSLKKRPTEWADNPTLINKVFNSILEGSQYESLWEEVQRNRMNFFVKVLKKATRSSKPLAGSNLNSLKVEQLWKYNLKEPKTINSKGKATKYENRKLINIKGEGVLDLTKGPVISTHKEKADQPYSLAAINDKGISLSRTNWKMRKFVNSEVAKGYFDELEEILNDNAEKFATGLLNLVLKPQLTNILTADPKLKYDYWFGFSLITAAGSVKPSGQVVVGLGNYKDIHTVMCGIKAVSGPKTKYTMVKVGNPRKTDNDDAAKVFYELRVKGARPKFAFLLLEIRFKGDFTAQPQFQAFLHKDFEDLLKEKCKV